MTLYQIALSASQIIPYYTQAGDTRSSTVYTERPTQAMLDAFVAAKPCPAVMWSLWDRQTGKAASVIKLTVEGDTDGR